MPHDGQSVNSDLGNCAYSIFLSGTSIFSYLLDKCHHSLLAWVDKDGVQKLDHF